MSWGAAIGGVSRNCLAHFAGKTNSQPVMDEIAPTTRPVPAGWLEALEESRAELAAGLTVLGDEIMRELYESIARLEARQTDSKARRVARPR